MRHILTAAIILSVSSAAAALRPHSTLTDHMVLQQQTDATLRGTDTPGSRVTAVTSWDGRAYTATTGADGRWAIDVATPAGSFTPYSITVANDGGENFTLGDVLVGEVWLASGQSNMQMPLRGFPGCCVRGGFEEIAAAGNQATKIRFYTVPTVQSYTPLDTVAARWAVPSADTAPEFSAVAWHYARRLADVLGVPVGIVSAAYGGARVESWTPRDMLERYPDVSLDPADIEAMTSYWRPMLMYNAMFNPVKGYTYKGIIWYQGCSNVRSWQTYADRLSAMITRWREEIGRGDIPFYAVEIAPYQYDDPDEQGRSPMLRLAQWEAVSRVPHADMICINDLVEPYERHNIHPGDKASVGKRLADLSLNRTYGRKQFMAGSPRYKSHRFEDGTARVAIDSPNNGICRNYDISGFEIAGPDGVFYPADRAELDWRTNEIIVASDRVSAPRAVRYGFGDFLPGTLYGGNYLPLIPFSTEFCRSTENL